MQKGPFKLIFGIILVILGLYLVINAAYGLLTDDDSTTVNIQLLV